MIAIIDYGMGNLGSVAKAFKAIGANVKVTSSAKDLNNSKKIVLPGVGAFRYCVQSLKRLKLVDVLMDNINNGKPYLGLCLGMQVLFDESEEGGRVKGLGILKGKVKRLKVKGLKVPHMGWNRINLRHCERAEGKAFSCERSEAGSNLIKERLLRPFGPRNDGKCPLLKDIPDGAWMYFVHSYYVVPKDKNIIATTTDYGVNFASMIWKDNIYATQFHPEKSQKLGMKMLENFVRL